MTSLVQWDPFRELDLMERGVRRFGMPLLPVLGALRARGVLVA